MKTVGIILREFKATINDLEIYGVGQSIIKYLKNYNINVICIPVDFNHENEFQKIKPSLDICDGIIFPGGVGINKIDCQIIEYLHQIDKPTLGICLGMQIMGKTFEGVVQEGGADKMHNTKDEYAHGIKVDKTSKLFKILGTSELKVNSRHNDCVTCTNLACVAKSENNLIEAIEDKNKKFFIGVQWHPESVTDDYSNKLFNCFIDNL